MNLNGDVHLADPVSWMRDEMPKLPNYWTVRGLSDEQFVQDLEWLEAPRSMQEGHRFFVITAKLLRFLPVARHVLGPAFSHAVFGLERALRVHYKGPREGFTDPGSTDAFSDLLHRAVDDGVIQDATFAGARVLEGCDDLEIDYREVGYARRLAEKIPWIRNHYVHGEAIEAGEFYQLTLHLRMAADALKTKGLRSLID